MRRRHSIIRPAPTEAPIATLNITPLIDVMLVLLIMFILTIPIATHKVRVDLPVSGPWPPKPPVAHELAIGAGGGLSWDGAPLGEAQLPSRLSTARTQAPEMVLRLRADGAARYEVFDRVLATVKSSGIQRLGFVGNEGFAGAIGLRHGRAAATAG